MIHFNNFEWIKNISNQSQDKSIGLIMHIPPGVYFPGMEDGWHEIYMNQFEHLKNTFHYKFSLVCHSHLDLFLSMFASSGQSTGYSLSNPALSSVHENNPGFRVYYYGEHDLVDYVQYFSDISKNPDELIWEKEYSFSEIYNQSELTFTTISKVVNWINSSRDGFWEYTRKIHVEAAPNSGYFTCLLSCTTKKQVDRCLSHFESESIYPYSNKKFKNLFLENNNL